METNEEESRALLPTLNKETQFSLAPRSLQEAIEFSEMMAKSNFVPKDLKDKPGDILVAVAMGGDVGLRPLQAIQNIAVINGRPSIWGDAAIALVKASPKSEWIKEGIRIDPPVGNKEQQMVAWCTVKRVGQEAETREFSRDDAIRAGLWGKDGTWKKYPKRMLQMRARSWALRDVFADVLSGLNIREETRDFDQTGPEPISEPTIVFEEPETPHDCIKSGHIFKPEAVEEGCVICGEITEATETPESDGPDCINTGKHAEWSDANKEGKRFCIDCGTEDTANGQPQLTPDDLFGGTA